MNRQRKEGGLDPSPARLSAFFTVTNALGVNECIQLLSKMLGSFAQGEIERQEAEILGIKSSVLRRLEMLWEEGGQNPQPSSQDRKKFISCLPPTRYAINTISGCITDLCKLQQLILQSDESTFIQESLYEEAIGINSGIMARLNSLLAEEEGSEEADGEAMDVEDPESPDEDEYEDGEGSDEDEYHGEGSDDYGYEYDAADEPPAWWPPPHMFTMYKRRTEFDDGPWQLKKVDFVWSGVNKEEMKENERYLCVSNGFAIWCLDLKLFESNTPHLPILDSLNLIGGEHPASVGLFKLGSDAYMIGGQQLPASAYIRMSSNTRMWGTKPQGINLYQALCYTQNSIKGSSHVSYRLSLASNKDGTRSLSCSEAKNIEVLKRPKFWPIVEKIGDKLHVMDSVPDTLCGNHRWTFSHEVGNLEGRGWKEITPTFGGELVQITNHMVVGNRIYAITSPGTRRYYQIAFDTGAGRWRGHLQEECLSLLEVRLLWDILRHGFGRCVGEYPHGGGSAYMVVAIVQDYLPDGSDISIAVVYLVTSKGQVVCYQVLHDFFEQPLRPRKMGEGTMFHVEHSLGSGWTMCSMFSARIEQDDFSRDYLFINTFSVEVLPDAADKVKQLLEEKTSEVPSRSAVEQKFVRIARKSWFIFETGAGLKFSRETPHGRFVGWQACFLTPPPS